MKAALVELHRGAMPSAAIPATLRIVPFGTLPDAGKLEYYASLGDHRGRPARLPGGDADRVLPILDEYAPLLSVRYARRSRPDAAVSTSGW